MRVVAGRDGVRKSGNEFEITLKAGEAIEATLDQPAAIPAAPADAAAPVVIKPSSTS